MDSSVAVGLSFTANNTSLLKASVPNKCTMDAETKEFLIQHYASDIMSSKTKAKPAIISVKPLTTWKQTLQLLNTNNILAVPVISEESEYENKIEDISKIGRKITENGEICNEYHHKFYGIISVVDLMKPLVKDESLSHIGQMNTTGINDEQARKQTMFNSKSIQSLFDEPVVSFFSQTPTKLLKENDTLIDVLRYFAIPTNNWGIVAHKIPNRANTQFSWISRIDVITYLHKHLNHLGAFKDENLLNIIEFKPHMDYIKDDLSAIGAFRVLYQNEYLENIAAPIVDSSQKVVGMLSASDLRGLSIENADNLLLPILDYLKLNSSNLLRQSEPFLVSIKTNDTLRAIIDAVVTNQVHRAFVEHQQKLVSFVTLTDICLGISQCFV